MLNTLLVENKKANDSEMGKTPEMMFTNYSGTREPALLR
jgi:hypothetical protein